MQADTPWSLDRRTPTITVGQQLHQAVEAGVTHSAYVSCTASNGLDRGCHEVLVHAANVGLWDTTQAVTTQWLCKPEGDLQESCPPSFHDPQSQRLNWGWHSRPSPSDCLTQSQQAAPGGDPDRLLHFGLLREGLSHQDISHIAQGLWGSAPGPLWLGAGCGSYLEFP